jgi:hypothetical protein
MNYRTRTLEQYFCRATEQFPVVLVAGLWQSSDESSGRLRVTTDDVRLQFPTEI